MIRSKKGVKLYSPGYIHKHQANGNKLYEQARPTADL